MLRAKSLEGVSFDVNTLFIQEQFSSDNVMGKVNKSVAGTDIVFQAVNNTPYITLDSKEHGIITEAKRDILMNMWDTIGTTYTLTYDNDSTETVRMAHEKEIVFTELWEGACEYTAIIPLAKA